MGKVSLPPIKTKSLEVGNTANRTKINNDGSMTVNGDITLAAGKEIKSSVSGVVTLFVPTGEIPTTITTDAAIPLTSYESKVDSSGGARANALADSTVNGQLKKITLAVDGNDCVITPATFADGTTFTLGTAAEYGVFLFVDSTTGWRLIENNGGVVA